MNGSIKEMVEALLSALGSPQLLATLVILCAVILFLPNDLAPSSMDLLKSDYGIWFTLVGLFSSIALGVKTTASLGHVTGNIRRRWSALRRGFRVRKSIDEASSEELLLLAAYPAVDYTAITLNTNEPVVRALMHQGVLVLTQSIAYAGPYVALHLSSEAESYIKKNGERAFSGIQLDDTLRLINTIGRERYGVRPTGKFFRAPSGDDWMRV